MPTPSDATAVPERSYADMVKQEQDAVDEQNKAVDEQRALHEAVQQSMIPHTKMPPVSGDCVIDREY